MAHIIPDRDLLTKAEHGTPTYAELAAIKMRAMSGDASAAIALDRMPASERRLAGMLVKAYGKPGKPRKPKKAKPKSSKQIMATAYRAASEHSYLRAMLNSDNPSEREAARAALGG